MSIKARFWVTRIERQVVSGGNQMGTVTLSAVSRKTDDNIDWAAYTPSGQITMSVHEKALAAFEELLGQDVYVDITPCKSE